MRLNPDRWTRFWQRHLFGRGKAKTEAKTEAKIEACQPQESHCQPRGAPFCRYSWVYARCHETWTTPVN
jgi:hypothetical protein